MFDSIDTNGSGFIDSEELRQVREEEEEEEGGEKEKEEEGNRSNRGY